MKNNITAPKPSLIKRIEWRRLIALLFVLAISVYIILIPEEQTDALAAWGMPGVFLLSVLANATLFLPAPFLIAIGALGARLNPLGVGIIGGVGAIVGELSGYIAGYSGQAVIDNVEAYERMVGWMERHGALTLIILAFIPNPLFDMTGIAAGALKMPVWKFLLYGGIGKIMKTTIVAYIGAGILNLPWLEQFLK